MSSSPCYPTPWKGPDSPYVNGEEYYPLLGCSYPPIDSKYWKSKKILRRLAQEHPQFYKDNFQKFYKDNLGKGKRKQDPDPEPEPEGERKRKRKRERELERKRNWVDSEFGDEEFETFECLPAIYFNKRFPVAEDDQMKCAEASLSSWNKKSASENGPEYELVNPLGCLSIEIPAIYHCNFIARPKHTDSTEDKLFFAELCHDYDLATFFNNPSVNDNMRCLFCCILGSPSSSTTNSGVCGCTICELDPGGYVNHPPRGGFQKRGVLPNLDHLTALEREDPLMLSFALIVLASK